MVNKWLMLLFSFWGQSWRITCYSTRNFSNLSGSQTPLKSLFIVLIRLSSSIGDMLEIQDLTTVYTSLVSLVQSKLHFRLLQYRNPHRKIHTVDMTSVALITGSELKVNNSTYSPHILQTCSKISCVKPPTFSHNAKDFKLIHHITKGGGSSSRWNELLGF